MKNWRTLICALLLGAAAVALTGCASDNPDNVSSLPWNQPQDWEGPMPSTINQGR